MPTLNRVSFETSFFREANYGTVVKLNFFDIETQRHRVITEWSVKQLISPDFSVELSLSM